MRKIRISFLLAVVTACVVSVSCGGGGGASSGSSTASNPGGSSGSGGGTGSASGSGTFAIALDSSTISVPAGENAVIKVTVSLPSGIASAAGTVTGLPNGVFVYPAVPLLLRAGTTNVALSTVAYAAAGSYPITFQASNGSQNVSASATLVITSGAPASLIGPPLVLALTPNGESSFIIYCVSQTGSNCSLNVSVSGLPAGVTIIPGSNFTTNQTGTFVTLSASNSVQTGNYIIAFTGAGDSFTSSFPVEAEVAQVGFFLGQLNSSYALRFGSSIQIPIQAIVDLGPGEAADYSVQFSVSGLPAGVTGTFSVQTVAVGQSITLTLTAAGNAPLSQNVNVLVTATPNTNLPTNTTTFRLDVVPPQGQLPTSRAQFVPTYGDIVSAVYDPVHQIVFASDNVWNRVEVYSLAQKKIIDTIPIPAPETLTMSTDGSKVLAGTDTTQVFWIDTTTREIVGSAMFPLPFQFSGIEASAPYQLSNGKILVSYTQKNTTLGGVVLWDPTAGTTSSISGLNIAGLPPYVARSGDGSKVIIETGDSAPAAYIYDTQSNAIATSLSGIDGRARFVAANQDGTRFMIGANIYDASLNKLGSADPNSQTDEITGVAFSPDGSIAYVGAASNTGDAIYSASVATASLVGTAPVLQLSPAFGTGPEEMSAVFAADSTGLIFGGSDYGMFVDDATLNIGLPQFGFSGSVSPSFGHIGSSTVVTVSGVNSLLPDVYLGGELISEVAQPSAGIVQFSTPSNLPQGPADLEMYFPSGAIGYAPQAFSFGPTIQFLNGNGGSTTGGTTLNVIGTGFSDPSQVQLSIAGKSATVTGVSQFAPMVTAGRFGGEYPFPSHVITATVPGGTTGAADVTLTTPDGTSTISRGFHYDAVNTYPNTDQFSDMIYDRFRNQVYLSASDHIDVFSVVNGAFASALVPPSLGSQKLYSSLALTPDGANLLALNATDNSVAVYNFAVPGSSHALSLGCATKPSGLAATADGLALMEATFPQGSCPSGSPASGMLSLDLGSGSLAESSIPSSCAPGAMRGSNDGSKVAFNSNFGFCVLDTASSTYSVSGVVGSSDFSASGDGHVFASGPYLTDSGTNALGFYGLPDVYQPNSVQLGVERLGDPGSLLYVAYPGFIDIFDVNRGDLRQRVTLAQNLPTTPLPLLAVDATGQNIFIATAQGLTRIQLDAAPLSIGYASPRTASTGATVTLRGIGFVSGCSVELNGSPVSANFIDTQTLNLVVPSGLPSGPVIVTVTNPSGDTYSLRSAFIAQ